MLSRSAVAFLLLMGINCAFALSPVPGFKLKNSLGDVTTYALNGKDIELSTMGSDFAYEDLTEKELAGIKKLMSAKQEYGKMFGFADWKSTGHRLIERNGERIVLIQGSYKDAAKKTVSFVEVYWASKERAGQYLITSNTIALKMDNFSEYLK